MSKYTDPKAPESTYEADATRGLWAALMLSSDEAVLRQIMTHQPVMVGQLDPVALRRAYYGKPPTDPKAYISITLSMLSSVNAGGPFDVIDGVLAEEKTWT